MPSILSAEAFNHEQLDTKIQTGMRITDNIVEIRNEDNIVDWFVNYMKEGKKAEDWKEISTNMFRCRSLKEEELYLQEMFELSDHVWKYFNWKRLLLDEWIYGSNHDLIDDVFIIYKHGDSFTLLDELPDNILFWKDNNEKWFLNHPSPDMFYVIRQE